jgi:hypothetical protein
MRCSYYPQSFVRIRGANREIESWIWRSWPAGSVHPELHRLHLSDRCSWPVWLVWALCGICLGWVAESLCLWFVLVLVSSWQFWRCFGWLCVGFFLPCRLSFEGVFVPGSRKVTEALWNICCAAIVAIGLTSSVHRSDRCHRSDWRRPSVWPL